MTDSNSGITQEMAKTMGITVLPMPFMINDETFFEDISLKQDEFYEKLEGGANIATSQPSPADVLKHWDDLLDTYEEIVYIPMSSGLSGSYETARMLSLEEPYEGRVFVVNNQRISVTQKQSVEDTRKLAESGYTGAEILNILENDKYNSSIYIMLNTLEYLKKGGRITPAAAALGTLLKIRPVLQIQGEKLDAFAKARTSAQGKKIMMNAIANDISTRFGGAKAGVNIAVAYTKDREPAHLLAEELKAEFPEHEILIAPLALSIACHIGPGSLAIAVTGEMAV